MTTFDRLEKEAIDDFERVLKESLSFGAETADLTYHRFMAHFERIARGIAIGHRRPDIPAQSPLAFVRVRPTHYLIAYNPDTQRVLRILDGCRNLPRLLS